MSHRTFLAMSQLVGWAIDSLSEGLLCTTVPNFGILPRRFVKMLHYGILSSTWKRIKLKTLQTALKVPPKTAVKNTLLRKCPCCKTGNLITIEVFGSRGHPANTLAWAKTLRSVLAKSMGKGRYAQARNKTNILM